MKDLGEHLARGGLVILSGDALRGGDLDLAGAASRVTPAMINFMALHGRGLICLGLTAKRAQELEIERQDSESARSSGRPFGRSIEARHGTTTGISAADRALTIATAVDPRNGPQSLISPGHIFPLIADPRGPSARLSTLEAGVAMMDAYGLGEGVVLCAMLREDGTMARAHELGDFTAEHDVPIVDIGEWVEHQ